MYAVREVPKKGAAVVVMLQRPLNVDLFFFSKRCIFGTMFLGKCIFKRQPAYRNRLVFQYVCICEAFSFELPQPEKKYINSFHHIIITYLYFSIFTKKIFLFYRDLSVLLYVLAYTCTSSIFPLPPPLSSLHHIHSQEPPPTTLSRD